MRRVGRIIGWGLLILLLVGLVALTGGSIVEVATGFGSTELTNVNFEATDGSELAGYLAKPDGDGPFPAVIMIHEWWGLNADMTEIADELAAEGYLVLAADAYRGRLTEQVPRALYISITADEAQMRSDLDDAFTYVQGLEQVDVDAIAVWGFCFGGSESLAMGTRNDQLAAIVDYYGSGPITDPAEFGVLEGPLLGVFGEVDNLIPLDEVEAFDLALDEAGVEHTITVYDDVGHAFLNSENLTKATCAAGQAWNQTVTFLDTHLKGE